LDILAVSEIDEVDAEVEVGSRDLVEVPAFEAEVVEEVGHRGGVELLDGFPGPADFVQVVALVEQFFCFGCFLLRQVDMVDGLADRDAADEEEKVAQWDGDNSEDHSLHSEK
jgi:hypothetical protein